VKVRISLAGLAVALSLLVGGVAGIVAYRYAASGGKPGRAVPAPAAAPPSPVATTAISSQPAVRGADPQFMQLTLTLDQPVPYDAHRLDHPDRVYIDLQGARLAPELAGKTLFVNNGGVSDIRLAQTQPDTVRVVLDLEKRFDYSVTQQTNPAALVVKLRPHARRKRRPASSQPKKASPQ
jgi:N-acetylmuramoyl-L-alanine amidase